MKMLMSCKSFSLALMLGTLLLLITSCINVSESEWGHFIGKVDPEWLGDGRTMRLKEDFVYVDPSGKNWMSPGNSEIDGASIPRAFWTLIGSPFSGKYRKASVVHDTACDTNMITPVETWKAVHKMFYQACRCGGVGETKAKVMYWAVYHFGPRWPDPSGTGAASQPVSQPLPVEKQLVALVRKGAIPKSQVYSAEKLRVRSSLLTEIATEERKLDLATTRLAELQNLVSQSFDLQSTKVKELEERRQARAAIEESLRTLRPGSLSPNEYSMKKNELQNQLLEAENQENIARSKLEALAKTSETHQNELQTVNSNILNIKDTKQKLIVQLRPEDEFVEMTKVIDHAESYIEARDPSLPDIESLDLDTLFRTSIE